MSAPEVTEAICLSVQKYSETSKIAVLYTRSWGRISVIAKGAFRPKSPFWGHLEPLAVVECVVYKKPREQLHLLSSCRAVMPWIGLAESPVRAGYAFAVGELLCRHTLEQGDNAIYNLARATLRALVCVRPDALGRQFWGFVLALLACLGFRPTLDRCDSCNRHPQDGQPVILDVAAGKIICRDCRARRRLDETARRRRLSAGALAELQRRLEAPILDPSEPETAPDVLEEAAKAIEELARFHLGMSRLRSLDFARRVGTA